MIKKNVNNKELGFEKCTIFFFFLKPRNAQTKQNRKEDLHVQFSSI